MLRRCGTNRHKTRGPLLEMPAATRRTVRAAANLLTATPDEAAIIIACALTDPTDLLHLAAACRRFFIKCIIAAPPPFGTAAVAPAQQAEAIEMWSIVEEAGRRWIADCTNQEQGWVPRRGRESWLGLMWEVEALRRGAVFGRSHAGITLSEGGSVATNSVYDSNYRAAASKAVMRAGRHYAQFTVEHGYMHMWSGVIRPGWDMEAGQKPQNAHVVDGHCFYYTGSGRRCPGVRDWEGMQGAKEDGDRIGLLLDLDQGTMTVYKNDKRLGVMATGLSGEYSWAVTLYGRASARIEAGPAPASPTAEELAQAVVYIAEHNDDD
eukprot:COSAG06_NODE_803_length_12172_cov_16.477595_5_plen_322_part_00